MSTATAHPMERAHEMFGANDGGHVHRLCRIWSRILNTSPVLPDSNFFELGGDSLLAVNLFLEIERETGKHLPITSIYDAPTVADQATLIENNDSSTPSSLVLLKTGSGAEPLFIVHGMGGTVIELAALGNNIRSNRCVYAIQACGLDGETLPLASVEAQAAAYIDAVRCVQPAGPYFLAGYSFGGLVALEMARQLAELDAEIGMLLLIDSYAHPKTWPVRSRLAMQWRVAFNRLRLALDRPVKETVARTIARARALARSLVSNENGRKGERVSRHWPGPPLADLPLALKQVHEASGEALRTYVPQSYAGEIVFLRAATTDVLYPADAGHIWRRLAGKLALHTVPGDHLALVREHSDHVAACIDAMLARCARGQCRD